MKSAACCRKEKNAVSLEVLWAHMDKELLALYARLELEPFGDEVLQREETRELVNTTMSQLPPHYREALEAKYVGGKSVPRPGGRLEHLRKGRRVVAEPGAASVPRHVPGVVSKSRTRT